MISRRLIRIKVLQIFYAYTQKPGTGLAEAEKELNVSLTRTLYLYYAILLLVYEIIDYAFSRIEIARAKKIPSWEDLNPNMRFVENRAVKLLRENEAFEKAIRSSGISWNGNENLVKRLYYALADSPAYQEYMSSEKGSLSQDVKIIRYMLTDLFAGSEDLEAVLEEESIYWNDELEFILSVLYKLFGYLSDNPRSGISPPVLFKNREDKQFSIQLLHQSILHRSRYLEWIERFTDNWDVDRIALMDILIITQGIAEVIHFTNIPTRVTINEYIEIAKYYSTPRSGIFINGVLDGIVHDLREKKMIKKSGRGLIGEKEEMP